MNDKLMIFKTRKHPRNIDRCRTSSFRLSCKMDKSWVVDSVSQGISRASVPNPRWLGNQVDQNEDADSLCSGAPIIRPIAQLGSHTKSALRFVNNH